MILPGTTQCQNLRLQDEQNNGLNAWINFKIQGSFVWVLPPIAIFATILDVAYNRSFTLLKKHMVDSKLNILPFFLSLSNSSKQPKERSESADHW